MIKIRHDALPPDAAALARQLVEYEPAREVLSCLRGHETAAIVSIYHHLTTAYGRYYSRIFDTIRRECCGSDLATPSDGIPLPGGTLYLIGVRRGGSMAAYQAVGRLSAAFARYGTELTAAVSIGVAAGCNPCAAIEAITTAVQCKWILAAPIAASVCSGTAT